MTWVKLDDGFPEHPKVVSAGPLAGWVHVCGLCYCNRNLTDGYVPRTVAHRLADFEHIGMEVGGVPGMVAVGVDVDCQMLVEILVQEGLWKEVDGGYMIHDYLDYNPSRDEVLAKRSELSAKRSEAGKKGAAARWNGNRDGKPMAKKMATGMANRWPRAEADSSTGSSSTSREDPLLPFSNIEPALELEIFKLTEAVTEKDNGSASIIRRYAQQLPLGTVVRIREKAAGKSARYVVGALKREIESRRSAA